MKKIAIIGAGPAGMFSAINSNRNNNDVILIERNNKVGRKLAITGKGRCNLTNSRDISEFFDEINTNPSFCYSPFYSYTNIDLINYFEKRGVKLKSERGGRVFPHSDNSYDIIDVLYDDIKRKDIKLLTDTCVKKVEKNDKFKIYTDEKVIISDSLIIASGGKSYPTTGSDGIGYELAKSLGHTITDLNPTLVPIQLKDEWVESLAGITLKNIELNLIHDNKTINSEFGELLFTHSGISGPVVLKTSTRMDKKKDYDLTIDLKPGLDYNELDQRIQRDFIKYNNKDFKNSLKDLTINALIPIIIDKSKINPRKIVNQITKEERHNLVRVFKNLDLHYSSLKDIKYGIVTKGGVDVNEINPTTMESKIVENLYFAGEIIDVDANTGGYNLQFAFSTAYLAGINSGGIL